MEIIQLHHRFPNSPSLALQEGMNANARLNGGSL